VEFGAIADFNFGADNAIGADFDIAVQLSVAIDDGRGMKQSHYVRPC
jgi:hypothetical protein